MAFWSKKRKAKSEPEIGEISPNPTSQEVLPKRQKERRSKAAAILLCAIFVLIASSGAIYFVFRQDTGTKEGATHGVCDAEVLKAALPYIDPLKFDIANLRPQVGQIEQMNGYDTDANCLYVTLIYNIKTGNKDKSKEQLEKLVQAYDPSKGYDPIIAGVGQAPDSLRPMVDFIQNAKIGFPQRGVKEGEGGE